MPSGAVPPAVGVVLSPSCQTGSAKTVLTPPPPAPPPNSLPSTASFQTVSLVITPPEAARLVPPQASACGLDAGKSTLLPPSVTPSLEPLSPDATQTVMPSAAAAWNAESKPVKACRVQLDSGPPQLIEMTEGLFTVSWIAVVIASRKPASVLGAK